MIRFLNPIRSRFLIEIEKENEIEKWKIYEHLRQTAILVFKFTNKKENTFNENMETTFHLMSYNRKSLPLHSVAIRLT